MHSENLTIQAAATNTAIKLPLFSTTVEAGFPSPADDYQEERLDLNELIIKHPEATFFVRVKGDSMKDAGITSGDILAVDRSLKPSDGKIVIAILDGEFTVKRIRFQNSKIFLLPENSAYPPFEIKPDSNFQVWGVVTYVIHKT